VALKAINNLGGDYPTVSNFKIQGTIGAAQYRVRNVITYFLRNDFDFTIPVHNDLPGAALGLHGQEEALGRAVAHPKRPAAIRSLMPSPRRPSARHAGINKGPAVAAAEFFVGRLLVAATPFVLLLHPLGLGGVPLLLRPFRNVFSCGLRLICHRLAGRLRNRYGRRKGEHGARNCDRHEYGSGF
jgi:hypothetical protein